MLDHGEQQPNIKVLQNTALLENYQVHVYESRSVIIRHSKLGPMDLFIEPTTMAELKLYTSYHSRIRCACNYYWLWI